LKGTDLFNTDFKSSDLSSADLSGAYLKNDDFTGAIMENIEFSNTKYDKKTFDTITDKDSKLKLKKQGILW
jgi:uncharacterized protein YjbI with pentapeptide repeats